MSGVLQDPVLNELPFLALFLPLAGFTALSLFGRAIQAQGEARGAMVMACATVAGSFAVLLLVAWRFQGLLADPSGLRFHQPHLLGREGFQLAFLEAGGLAVPFHLLVDPLSLVMALTVSGVGFLIHVYSVGYMAHDEEPVRYFAYLNLFIFFMLLLVLGGSLPLLFVGWEGVGLCSYLLIGFWYRKQSASDAGLKAFVVNRVGDAGLILGMIVAFHSLGSLDLVELVTNAQSKPAEAFGSPGVLTAVALLLFVGACGKSAQLPLHVWLPDAMEGPTPVSALIHAATMVTAGVYLVVRFAPLFVLSETAMATVATLGALTAFVAASIALVQNDIKKVLAYSTVSQLGYMFLACGVGAFGVAIFHLFTHAFFKALLFLGSGSVIHALGGEQDMRRMGGLRRRIPWTFWTFVIGTLALAGVPPLAGFFSKDAILAGALGGGGNLLFGAGLLTAVLTAFYMGRLMVLTFFGGFRGDEDPAHPIHESPPSMLVPLVLLALGSLVTGFVPIPHLIEPVLRGAAAREAHYAWLPWVATLGALLGLVAAWYLYALFRELPGRIAEAAGPLRRLLEAKWGFDLFFDWLTARIVVGGSRLLLWKGLDVSLIDGAVNGAGALTGALGRQVRTTQTGLVRVYALVILGGGVALLGYLLWLR
jgi:NADH-quinone oxidoreductase subunit L